MDSKYQLTSDNNYSPSSRANAAVDCAKGSNHGAPDKADVEGRTVYKAVPKEADQPSNQHTGGIVMGDSQKGHRTSEQPGSASSGYGTNVDKGNM
jgi:hypothetical protein